MIFALVSLYVSAVAVNQLITQLGKNEVVPGFEPGLLEDSIQIKIQSDNHYTTQPCCVSAHPRNSGLCMIATITGLGL